MNALVFILLLGLAGCATQPAEAVKPRPLSFRESSAQADPLTVSESRYWTATWSYSLPMPADNIEFDVVGTTNLQDWYLIATTNQPPVGWWSDKPMEIINVGAHWMIQPELH